jgi:hypothetical protein
LESISSNPPKGARIAEKYAWMNTRFANAVGCSNIQMTTNPLSMETPMKRPEWLPKPVSTHPLLVCVLLSLITCLVPAYAPAEVDPQKNTFTYSIGMGIDESLAQIAQFLIKQNRVEGGIYTSKEVEKGIVGYKIRYFDSGNNQEIERDDWLSVRRYRIPADPDTTLPDGYFKNTFIEYVDTGLDGMDTEDYYFIDGRRFELHDQKTSIIQQYQVQIESGISTFMQKVGYQTILAALGQGSQTAIKKREAFEDGSLPSAVALGLDLKYVFRPIIRSNTKLPEEGMIREIRQNIGFVFSASTAYTDVSGYRFRDIYDKIPLLERTYDPMEVQIVTLIIDALFDPDGDGIILPADIKNGYSRFRAIHQELTDNARSMNQRIILPNEKLARLRQEYRSKRGQDFKF